MSRKISALGWYNHENIGDEAFKLAFPKLFPGDDVVFTEAITDTDVSDAYILGGGDVCYDVYTNMLNNFPDKPRIALSVTLTDNSDYSSLKNYDHVYVRDNNSLSLGKNYLDPNKLSYLPDATFLLKPDKVAGHDWLVEAFSSEGLHLYNKIVVCVISAYTSFHIPTAFAKDFINFINVANQLANVADNTPASFVFLPFSTKSPHDDRMSNAMVADRCKYYEKNYVVYQRLDVQTTLNIISCAQAVISSRLHSTIFSTLSGVPFIDVTHHNKNQGFVSTLGKPEWSLPLWDFNSTACQNILHGFMTNTVPDASLQNFTEKSQGQLSNAIVL